jgi:hypothetical protein
MCTGFMVFVFLYILNMYDYTVKFSLDINKYKVLAKGARTTHIFIV